MFLFTKVLTNVNGVCLHLFYKHKLHPSPYGQYNCITFAQSPVVFAMLFTKRIKQQNGPASKLAGPLKEAYTSSPF
jgi:hypothetical protein